MDNKKNILTALGSIFSRRKVNELDARLNIEKALHAQHSQLAANPPFDPTNISDKGIRQGAILTDEMGVGTNYYRYIERESLRHLRYTLYDRMDTDLIASALDVYANEATQKNANRKLLQVSSKSAYIQNELDELLDRLGINSNKAWNVIRDMCKYGDHFASLKLDSRFGVLEMKAMNAASIYRMDRDNNLLGYIQDINILRDTLRSTQTNNITTNPYMNLNTIGSQYVNRGFTGSEKPDDKNNVNFLPYELVHFKVTGRGLFTPYGNSLLEQAVDIWKKLDLLVDSLVIYRLNKAPSRFVFYVDVGNNQGGDIEAIIKKQMQQMNKKEYMDSNGKINERYQLLDMNANIYLPTGKNTNSKVDLLQGAGNLDQIEDVKYLNDRLFSALKVPKAFLGFEGEVSGKGMLSQQNVTFSKAIQNIQEDFLQTVKDICLIHLAIKGITDNESLKSFELIMTHPSYIEEKARIEIESQRLALATSWLGIQGIDPKWVLKSVLNKTDAEIAVMLTAVQPQAAMGGLPPMGGGMPIGGMDMGGDMGMGSPDMSGQSQGPDLSGAIAQQPAPMMNNLGTPAGAGEVLQQSYSYVVGDLLIESRPTCITFDSTKFSELSKYCQYKLLIESDLEPEAADGTTEMLEESVNEENTDPETAL